MNKISQLSAMALIFLFHLVSFGMQRAPRLSIQQQRGGAKNRAAAQSALAMENKYHQKLLEHPCFKGESLKFQNQFFSSAYKDIPGPVSEHFNMVAQPINGVTDRMQMDHIFAYHAHYRKGCIKRVDSLASEIVKKRLLYDRRLHKLLENPDDIGRFFDVRTTRNADLKQHIKICDMMMHAFFANDYPFLLWIHENYKNGTLSA